MAINYSLREVAYAFKQSDDVDTQSETQNLFVNISSETVDRIWYNDTINFISHKWIVVFIGTGQAREHDNKNIKG